MATGRGRGRVTMNHHPKAGDLDLCADSGPERRSEAIARTLATVEMVVQELRGLSEDAGTDGRDR